MSNEFTLSNIPSWSILSNEATLSLEAGATSAIGGSHWQERLRTHATDTDSNHPGAAAGHTPYDPDKLTMKTSRLSASILGIDRELRAKQFKAKLQGNRCPESLTTKELLALFATGGMRPATLPELVAYARDVWRPEAARVAPFVDSEESFKTQMPYVYALGSIFATPDGLDFIPYLRWDGEDRLIDTVPFLSEWDEDSWFLVVRQEVQD